jgi:hypothetical protein
LEIGKSVTDFGLRTHCEGTVFRDGRVQRPATHQSFGAFRSSRKGELFAIVKYADPLPRHKLEITACAKLTLRRCRISWPTRHLQSARSALFAR